MHVYVIHERVLLCECIHWMVICISIIQQQKVYIYKLNIILVQVRGILHVGYVHVQIVECSCISFWVTCKCSVYILT